MARLRLTLTLDSGARIGPGKAELLESVRVSGSISAAARALRMDYKRAWLLLDSINRAFVTPAVERVTGGTGGGGAVLTPFGESLLTRYRKLEAAAQRIAAADLKAPEKQATPDPGPKVQETFCWRSSHRLATVMAKLP
jgi:molybdate transport system regulatory protein